MATASLSVCLRLRGFAWVRVRSSASLVPLTRWHTSFFGPLFIKSTIIESNFISRPVTFYRPYMCIAWFVNCELMGMWGGDGAVYFKVFV